jgi:AcrR family transcriptional regulator
MLRAVIFVRRRAIFSTRKEEPGLMPQVTSLASRRAASPAVKGAQARADKLESRRVELAEATLETLAELGYARTSLREIAQNSEFSHGVLHYYFSDKVDLICCGVRYYKAKCVTRYDGVVATATSRKALLDGFCAKLEETLTQEAKMHRLWYDLRSRAFYEEAFRADIDAIDKSLENMVWRIASRYAELASKPIAVSKVALYALFDGLFQRHLLLFLAGDQQAASRLTAEIRVLLPKIA